MESSRTLVEEHPLWTPVSEQDRLRVHEQMERLLSTGHFRKSRRYPALFRFIVEEALAGRGEYLKERILGVQVFGRPVDYDTASDPVVRVTVAEIRKRIAQYYHDEGHEHELRIELLPGHYEPEFRLGREDRQPQYASSDAPPDSADETHAPAVESGLQLAATSAARPAATTQHSRWTLWAGGTAAALAIMVVAGWAALRPSSLDRFWSPVLGAHRPVLLCLPVAGGKYGVAASSKIILPTQDPSLTSKRTPAATGTYLELESLGENVVFSDVRAMMSLSDLLSQRNVEQHPRLNTAVTLDDLRQGPAILIGGMDNQWTLRAISHLRYQFGGNDQETYWVVDTRTGQPSGWSLDLKAPSTSVTRDYAIIARVHAEDTGQPQVIVAGIGMSGTAAAGEVLTDAAQMEALRRRVGAGFDHRDFEAVISTDVVNGIAGTPKILTVEMQ